MKNLLRKLRSKAGYSLAEALLAVLLVALLSTGIAAGVAFGARQYGYAMSRSEARILASTLTSILRDELSNTTEIDTSGGGFRYYSPHYTPEITGLDPMASFALNADGQLVLTTKRADGGTVQTPFLAAKAYSKTQKLTVEIPGSPVTYSDGAFHVRFTVKTASAGSVDAVFDVIPLNTVKDNALP